MDVIEEREIFVFYFGEKNKIRNKGMMWLVIKWREIRCFGYFEKNKENEKRKK